MYGAHYEYQDFRQYASFLYIRKISSGGNMKKTVLAVLAVSMLFALPLSAGAAPVFPNLTGVRINGSPLTFLNMSGVVHTLNVSIVQVAGNGALTKNVSIFHKGVETKGLADPNTLNFLVPDESGKFVEFQDVVVFDDKAALGLRGLLLTPKGNKAFGPADFSLFIPPVVKNGDRLRIDVAVDDVGEHGCDFLYRVTVASTGREVSRVKTGVAFYDYAARRVAPTPAPFRSAVQPPTVTS